MKSNDALLAKMIEKNEQQYDKVSKLISDERIVNPSRIKVSTNEVVYLHFFHSNAIDFDIQINTAMDSLRVNAQNTNTQNSNTIIRAVSDITFTSALPTDFYVQLLRIQY